VQEIAAKDSADRRPSTRSATSVYRRGNPSRGFLREAAARAIELGGKYDGHELPDDFIRSRKRRRRRSPAPG